MKLDNTSRNITAYFHYNHIVWMRLMGASGASFHADKETLGGFVMGMHMHVLGDMRALVFL